MNGCNLEWQPTIRDIQWGPGLDTAGPTDLLALSGAVADAQATPLEPVPLDYDTRAVYDSRPVNAYDFNFCANNFIVNNNTLWAVGWQVPLGYRAVIREFEVQYDQDVGGQFGASLIFPLQGMYPSEFGDSPSTSGPVTPTVQTALAAAGFPLQNNAKAIGSGGKIKTFYIAEEGTWFGLEGISANIGVQGTCTVNAYGQFIPIRNEQLPFVIANQKPAGSVTS
jgi:hypothetical protein